MTNGYGLAHRPWVRVSSHRSHQTLPATGHGPTKSHDSFGYANPWRICRRYAMAVANGPPSMR